ncbi:hypothetical protein ACLKA7_010722 [Drosophila subpalustris]
MENGLSSGQALYEYEYEYEYLYCLKGTAHSSGHDAGIWQFMAGQSGVENSASNKDDDDDTGDSDRERENEAQS